METDNRRENIRKERIRVGSLRWSGRVGRGSRWDIKEIMKSSVLEL